MLRDLDGARAGAGPANLRLRAEPACQAIRARCDALGRAGHPLDLRSSTPTALRGRAPRIFEPVSAAPGRAVDRTPDPRRYEFLQHLPGSDRISQYLISHVSTDRSRDLPAEDVFLRIDRFWLFSTAHLGGAQAGHGRGASRDARSRPPPLARTGCAAQCDGPTTLPRRSSPPTTPSATASSTETTSNLWPACSRPARSEPNAFASTWATSTRPSTATTPARSWATRVAVHLNYSDHFKLRRATTTRSPERCAACARSSGIGDQTPQ